jgi:hypothetical protein
MMIKRIYADFNNRDAQGHLRLNCVGTISDLIEQSLEFHDGMRLLASDGDISAEIIVLSPGEEHVWRGEILFETLIDNS